MKDVGTYMLWPFGIFDGQLIKVMAIWHILWSLGTFFLVLLCCIKINLATLHEVKSQCGIP
jgi:hypothetical protein